MRRAERIYSYIEERKMCYTDKWTLMCLNIQTVSADNKRVRERKQRATVVYRRCLDSDKYAITCDS